MTMTLYKNSQNEADSPDLIYKDQWAISPYKAASMFCSGETKEQKDFVLPPDITFNKDDGFRHLNKASCMLSTNDKGQPELTVSYMRPFVLFSQEEINEQYAKAKKARRSWVPGYDKNGELEIF